MARINLYIPDELENEFRTMIFQKYGLKKGNIAKAIEEAINLWIENEKKRRYANVK
jgi:regulator of replication initiation timing